VRDEAKSERQQHIVTVSVEDSFHVGAFASRVYPKHWGRLQPRLERNIDATLDLLNRGDARVTFFVLGCVAHEQPRLIEKIVNAGHEIASSGYWPRGIAEMVVEEFREDLRRAKDALEAAG
jgi:peptidoglycan/xylan/chitin deacetylase (PgdA/CDA1 family)